MKVPFVDLKAQYATIADEVNVAIQGVLDRCDFVLGSCVEQFEEAFASYIGSKCCVGVASGTDALCLALLAGGVGEGDEVIVPANTYIATALAVTHSGAKPVLVDVNPETYNMDVEKLESVHTARTKAIIPVHLYGQAADMTSVMTFAGAHDLIVIEDACQAHGATCESSKCGAIGDLGCFSFYPGKNLGAYGDGGAIVTSDRALFEKLLMLRNYGQKEKHHHLTKGYNSRLDAIQAAVLNVKLNHLDEWSEARRRNAALYGQHLSGIDEISVPTLNDDGSHVFHLYVIRAERRDDLLTFLGEKDVSCGIHYPIPIHSQEAYADLGYGAGDFPVTEAAAEQILSLPMYSELTEAQILYIAECVKGFYC